MKFKNLITFVLTLALLLTNFVVAFAAADQTKIEITVNKAEIAAGESATVSVKVTTNYPVATMSIPVFFDKTKVDVENTSASLTGYKVASVTTNATSADAAKVFANTGLSQSQYGFVLVNYIAEANAQLSSTISSVVLTFNITAKETASGDAVIKAVTGSVKTESNIEGMLYFGKAKSTTLNEMPTNVTSIDITKATTKVSVVEGKNEIVFKDGAEVEPILDTTNSDEYPFVYGIDTLANITEDGSLADNLTTKNGDAYLEIIGDETTGAIINVLDKKGNIVETYIFIYFGDIDADGMISSTDGFMAEYYEAMGEGIDTVYALMAGDVDGSGDISSTDGFNMEYFEAMGEGLPSQQEIAEMVSGNYYEL